MELLKLLSTSEIVAQIIGFLLLLFFLRLFAWKKILKLLDDRKEHIALELKNIEDAKLEVSKMKSEYESKISQAGQMFDRKIQEAMEEGKKVNEVMRKKAYEQAQEIIENAKKNMEYELSRAKEEVKNEIIDMVIKGADELIGEKLTAEQDKKLVADFLDEIDKAK